MNTHPISTHRQLPHPVLRRALRQAAGLSQAGLADHLGVSRAAVSRWETGDRNPQGCNRTAYAAVLRELRELVD